MSHIPGAIAAEIREFAIAQERGLGVVVAAQLIGAAAGLEVVADAVLVGVHARGDFQGRDAEGRSRSRTVIAGSRGQHVPIARAQFVPRAVPLAQSVAPGVRKFKAVASSRNARRLFNRNAGFSQRVGG